MESEEIFKSETVKQDKKREKATNSCQKPPAVRSLSFTPLRINLLQDILEAANEPLSTVEDVLESDDDKDDRENLNNKSEIVIKKENKEEIEQNIDRTQAIKENVTENGGNNVNVNDVNILYKNEMFDEDETFCKYQKHLKNPTEVTNQTAERNRIEKVISTPFQGKQTYAVKDKFCTPASKASPKVQCSLDMGLLFKTPLNSHKPFRSMLAGNELQTPMRFKGSVSGQFNGEILKVDKVFGSLKKGNGNIKENLPVQSINFNFQSDKKSDEFNSNAVVQSSNIILNNLTHSFSSVTINNKTYLILKELGKGGSSVVYSCFDFVNKEERALKKVFLSRNQSSAIEYINEVEILRKLQKCDRIVRMYDSEIQEDQMEGKLLWVVLEKGGLDLGKILKKVSNQKKALPLHVIMFYWMEMLYAVKQIHENGIIHSDLKPANFVNAESSLKLIDFGIASCIQKDMTSIVKNVAVGSFDYISPEALHDNSKNSSDSPNIGKPKFKISFKSDVWSLGCILYQLVYGRTPFYHIGNISAKLSLIMDPNHEIGYPFVEKIPEKFVNTIKKCLQYNVKQRPTVDELINTFQS